MNLFDFIILIILFSFPELNIKYYNLVRAGNGTVNAISNSNPLSINEIFIYIKYLKKIYKYINLKIKNK